MRQISTSSISVFVNTTQSLNERETNKPSPSELNIPEVRSIKRQKINKIKKIKKEERTFLKLFFRRSLSSKGGGWLRP